MDSAQLPVVERLPPVREVLRIAVVTETYPPEVNGVANTVARFVRGLCERRHEVQLVRPRQAEGDRPDRQERFHEILQRGLSIPAYPDLKMGLPARRALQRLWSAGRPDLVHIVTEGPLGWSALQAATKLKLPVSSDFRTNFHAYSRHYGVGWLRQPIAAYLRKFHNRTGLTMVPTEALRRELAQRGFRNLEVVARGVDTALFNPARRSESLRGQWGAGPGTPVAVYVGRIAAEKNLDALVAAFDAIRRRTPAARLVVVGSGPAEQGLRVRLPDAHFAGQRSGEDLAVHYASADAFVFPSLTETFGNVTVEAMASGLAVLAFDYAAAAEYLRHDVSGMLAPYGDADAFARMAGDLVADSLRIRRFGLHARAIAESLEWARVIESFESLLLRVVQSDPRAQVGAQVFAGVAGQVVRP